MPIKHFLIIFFLIVFLSAALPIGAVSLKVVPAELNIEARAGELVEKKLLVENPGKDVALFKAYPDNFLDFITIAPASFILESEQTKEVVLSVRIEEEAAWFTFISIKAEPLLSGALKASSGVKIPLNVKTLAQKKNLFSAFLVGSSKTNTFLRFLWFLLVLVAVLSWLVYYNKKRSFKKQGS